VDGIEILILLAAYPLIETPAIGPVAFHPNPTNLSLLDEATGQNGTPEIELMGPMRGFTDADETLGRELSGQRVEITGSL
jgi:hypothetical protein